MNFCSVLSSDTFCMRTCSMWPHIQQVFFFTHTRCVALLMAALVCELVGPLWSRLKYSMNFCTDIHGSQRVNQLTLIPLLLLYQLQQVKNCGCCSRVIVLFPDSALSSIFMYCLPPLAVELVQS